MDTSKYDFRTIKYLQISEEEFLSLYDAQPSFGMYRDNYFITGVPTNKEINKKTADAKYQISISQRLTKSRLPFKTSLLLTYTQKSFWDIYENSSPFADNNYNPGITLIRPVLSKQKLKGGIALSFEHESNGLDTINSRSWNFATLSAVYFYNANISVQGKIWAGVLGDENKDLFDYRGYGLMAFNYRSFNDNFWGSLVINPNNNFSRVNTILELNFKPIPSANQYIFLQWYNGYGENLFDYNQYTSMLRFGLCIKPAMRNFY
ncbi:phospholipase A [Cyclobacterium sp. 1_MG-2023]|uniref:phospholipase A n=1 Tax=Cyclobacterium sp. 1_MG-2023 TaxID=3062681 RepID=UPI0026E35001|nr:phospholipase A [Cyclobacterium sp. 1_MG-2023]MDO6435979.1 phospholipase A [Cyclobacterium sp. 1_MG-2023]